MIGIVPILNRLRTTLTVPLLLVLVSLTTATATATVLTGPVAHVAAASLSVSPTVYVGGQRLDWTGTLGRAGVRPFVLQFHMGRDGDAWTTVEGFESSTNADGSFAFTSPAPGMFNISYRVKAGRFVSPSRLFVAKTQDLIIGVTDQPEDNTQSPVQVRPGEAFGITVDTTPERLFRSPDTGGLPVYAGRALTLQRRVDGDTWTTLATTTVDTDGQGYFTGLSEPPGTVVYRVRQEDYLIDGNQIGWAPSFPLYVLVGESAERPTLFRSTTSATATTTSGDRGMVAARQAVAVRKNGATGTASQRYGWYPMRWDFAWEYGQSLTSPPERGTKPVGGWLDYSDGSGRVSKHNGGLSLDSKRYIGAGAGDFGTTRATLQGNPMKRGRWETRMRVRTAGERDGQDYKILAELVPANLSDYDCGNHNITIASVAANSQQVQFGTRTATHQWTGTAPAGANPMHMAYAVAVEVSKKRITWFLNGQPVGSVKSNAALPTVPMTLRLSLEGSGESEMNQMNLLSDWQRGFPISTGKTVHSAPKLARSAVANDC